MHHCRAACFCNYISRSHYSAREAGDLKKHLFLLFLWISPRLIQRGTHTCVRVIFHHLYSTHTASPTLHSAHEQRFALPQLQLLLLLMLFWHGAVWMYSNGWAVMLSRCCSWRPLDLSETIRIFLAVFERGKINCHPSSINIIMGIDMRH